MTTQSSLRDYARIVQHFTSTRAPEVLALQASPFFGIFFGGYSIEWWSLFRLGLLLFGSLALTAHIFIFNDWIGHSSDTRDPQRAILVFSQQGISSNQVAQVVIALFIIAAAMFFIVGRLAILVGTAIAILGLLYSSSSSFGKNAPIVGSINHLLGGMLHFLLGYTFFHTLDSRGFVVSIFFGLVFAGGHLNQEVRDYEGDLLNNIRTTAVTFGRHRTFLASLCTFSAAYALVTGLAALDILPRLLLWSPILWLLHTALSFQAFQRGLGFESAVWMQKRYRLLFALLGLAMLTK